MQVLSQPLAVPDLTAMAGDIRRAILRMSHRAKCGHIGSAFSCVEILSALYASFLRVDPKNPRDPARDRFILSKGHAAAALYAALCWRGFFEESVLETYIADGSMLPGHPSMLLPGIDASTGSLGHGLGIGAGMALAAQRALSDARTVVLLSDGECDEGATWEAALFAAQWKLGNLIAIIDRNFIQGYGRTEDVLRLEPLSAKWESFGWHVQTINGHDTRRLLSALETCQTAAKKPHVIIANTVKGKGVSFMENTVDWHYWTLDDARFEQALSELSF